MDDRNANIDKSKSLHTTPINTNIADPNSSNTVVSKSKYADVQSMHDTVTFRNGSPPNTNDKGTGVYTNENKNYNIDEYSSESQDQTNGISAVSEDHVPEQLPSDVIVRGSVASVVSKFQNTSHSLPPSIPPKTSRKKETVTSKQSTTMPSLRSSSPGLNNPPKYSPPVAPRIKKPKKLPKPENNNVQ